MIYFTRDSREISVDYVTALWDGRPSHQDLIPDKGPPSHLLSG
jgi:hypothetical protein